MFDLEKQIAAWRAQMLAAGIKTPAPLEELENHLREEIERQMKSGLSEQTSFEVAIQQIGKANILKNEFEKVAGAKELRAWKWMQIIFFADLGVISLFATTCVVFRLGSFSEISPAQQLSMLAAIAVMIFLAGGGYFSSRYFPVVRNKRTRAAISISSGVLMATWWAIFFLVIVQRVNFTTSELDLAITWSYITPFGALAGFVTGLEKAARGNSAPASLRKAQYV